MICWTGIAALVIGLCLRFVFACVFCVFACVRVCLRVFGVK